MADQPPLETGLKTEASAFSGLFGFVAKKLFEALWPVLSAYLAKELTKWLPEIKAAIFGELKEWLPTVVTATVTAVTETAGQVVVDTTDKVTDIIPGQLDDQVFDGLVENVFTRLEGLTGLKLR